MEGKYLLREIAKCIPIAQTEYRGNWDLNCLRIGSGDERWHHECLQTYKGQFLQDSLHGAGRYSWTVNNDEVVYEGQFYASNLEGYGRFSYNDTSMFEGLFKGNSRFGPGIFTHPDGRQDVGMWYGKNLVRLCCVVQPEWVPRLAKTPAAKTQLLKFKKLVSVCNIHRDKAKGILERLEANEDVMNESDKLYNVCIRNPKSHFFNTPLYDKQYFCENDCYIEVALSPQGEQSYSENHLLEKSDQASEGSSSSGSSLLLTTADSECVCIDPKQIRIDEITSELEHLEKVLSRVRNEINEAQFRKKLAAKRMESEGDVRKSVAWEKVEVIGGDTIAIETFSHEKFSRRNSSCEEECELEKEEEIDFDTACKQLAAAQNAEKLLLRKKNHLINKLAYEKESCNKRENEIHQHPTKRVFITDLLAWNNEETSTEMLKHVFLHRNFEKNMSYCVANLLAGDRAQFRSAGAYEEDCITFLKLCSEGSVKRVTDLLWKRDLNPDLCDAKGNTGMIYAAVYDRIRVIKVLVNFGANVDVFNDECLTPLGICVARYLAVQQNVTDWEAAFLKTTSVGLEEEQEVREWRPHVSLSSLVTILKPEKSLDTLNCDIASMQFSRAKLDALSELFGSNLNVDQNNLMCSIGDIQHILYKHRVSQTFQEPYFPKTADEAPQPYLLSTECVKPQLEKKKKEKKGKKGKKPKSPRSDKSSKKSDKLKVSSKGTKGSKKLKSLAKASALVEPDQESLVEDDMKPEEILLNNKLSAIYDTISTLLKYGANPNACKVPIPTLILAIFTKNSNLIEDLLRCKSDPNITTSDEKLTALHVLVSLPPCEEHVEIAKLLVNYSADPNCKASVHHWVEQKMELVAQRPLVEEDEGKTPLHLLSMRYDFKTDTNGYLNKIVPILMERGGKVKVRYLGHTPLSLAIMRGNIDLVKTFLDTKRINPNQLLGEKMGVPLTLFILKKYQNILPDIFVCQNMIQLLLEYKANPLEKIEDYGNAIEFMIEEHQEPSKVEKQKKGKKDEKKKKGKGKSKSSGSKKSDKKGTKNKKGKREQQVQEEMKRLLMTATKTVLEKHMKGYAMKYLYFFVKEEDYYDDISANMARFVTPEETVRVAQILVHRGEIPIDPSINFEVMYDLIEFIINIHTSVGHTDEPASAFVDIYEMLKDLEFKKISKEQGKLNLLEPEAERHSEKYNVCFHCYRKKNRQLFICPDCALVYFCSQQCNVLNNKEKNSPHKCGTLSYDRQKEIYEERLARAHHWQYTSETMKQLPELALKKGWIEEHVDIWQKRQIEPDPRRRLHLTRELRRLAQKETSTQNLKICGTSYVSLRQQPSQLSGQSILSERWFKEGSEFLAWRFKAVEGSELTGKKQKYKVQAEKGKTEGKKLKSRGYFPAKEKESEVSYERLPSGGKGEKRKTGLRYEDQGKLHKGKRDGAMREDQSDGGERQRKVSKGEEHDGEATAGKHKGANKSEEYGETPKTKVHSGKEKVGKHGQITDKKAEKKDRYSEDYDKGGGRGSGLDGEKALAKLEVDKVALAGVKCKDFAPEAKQLTGYVPMPTGGRILELERRLPSKYQYFLEKINEYWPDFDLSMLFLPYACYSNGQLYYRFLSRRPVFMETYSNI